MADVPILNTALSVEAIDFQRWNGHWLGIVLAPWCMSVLMVPGSDIGWVSTAENTRHFVKFPAGDFAFLGGDEPEFWGVPELFAVFTHGQIFNAVRGRDDRPCIAAGFACTAYAAQGREGAWRTVHFPPAFSDAGKNCGALIYLFSVKFVRSDW